MTHMRGLPGYLATFGGVILIALAVPTAILVIGTPIVLVVRLVLEIGRAL
jgi:hypothetical protein